MLDVTRRQAIIWYILLNSYKKTKSTAMIKLYGCRPLHTNKIGNRVFVSSKTYIKGFDSEGSSEKLSKSSRYQGHQHVILIPSPSILMHIKESFLPKPNQNSRWLGPEFLWTACTVSQSIVDGLDLKLYFVPGFIKSFLIIYV